MRKDKKVWWKSSLKRLITHAVVHSSLIFSSLPLHANTQVKNQGVGTAVGLINTAGQIYMQYLNSRPTPSPCDSLNPGAEVISSQLFPGCPVFRAQSAFPEGACQNISSPQGHTHADSCRAKATQYVQTLENLLSEAQNTTNPKGVQCLEASRKNVMTSIEDRLNNLRAFATRIKKETQMFKEQNKAMLDEMSNVAQELYGQSSGDGKTGQNERTSNKNARDFSKYFGASCKNIIGNNKLNSASKGLVGIQDGMRDIKSTSDDYNFNKSSYQRDLNKKIASIQQEVSKRGIGPWLQTLPEGGKVSGFASVDSKLVKEITDFSIDYSRLKSEVTQTLGSDNDIYQLPEINALSSTFIADLQSFRTGAKVYFKKKYINQCVTMEDKGAGLTTGQILGALEYPATNGFGDALAKYKLALQNILDADIYMDEKLIRIRALDQQFGGGIIVNYQDSGAGYVKERPFALYQKIVLACEARFEEDNTYSTTESSGASSSAQSMAKKIEVAEQKIKEIENMSRLFVSELTQKMSDELNNCSGRDYKAETCEASGSIMKPASEGFCLAHASKCSEQTSSCYLQADKLITERKTSLEAKAKVYNTNVANLIARQEAILTQMKTQVLADAEFIKKYFPGATWEFPKDLLVKMPEEAMVEAYGVKLRGGEDFNLTYLDELAKKIEGELVVTLQKQRDKADAEIGQYIAKQQQAMSDNKNKWEQLKATCEGSMKAFEANYAKQMAEQQRAAHERNQEKLDHCGKVDQILSSNPLGLCGRPGNLFEDSSRIAASLDKESADLVNEANRLCDEAQSEGILGTEKEGDKEGENTIDILAYCNISSDPQKKVVEKYVGSLPQNVRAKARSFLNSSPKDLSALEGMEEDAKLELDSIYRLLTPDSSSTLLQALRDRSQESEVTKLVSGDDAKKQEVFTNYKSYMDAFLKSDEVKLDKIDITDVKTDTELSYCDRLKLNAVINVSTKTNFTAAKQPDIKGFEDSLKAIGSKLSGPIDRAVASSKERELEESFSRLGENYTGACNGDTNLGRNSLEALDSSILGAGGLNNLYRPSAIK